MPQPVSYVRQADFSGHSAASPTLPHSGIHHDAEYDAIKRTLDQMLGHYAIAIADDGSLVVSSVHFETLDDELQAAISGGAIFRLPDYPVPPSGEYLLIYEPYLDGTTTRYRLAWRTPTVATGGTGTAAPVLNSIASAHIVDGTITGTDIANRTITSANLASDAVGTNELAPGAVTTAKLAGNAVTSSKIANNSITGDDIASGAIRTTELADNAVTSSKIANNSITGDDIAANAIRTIELNDGAVTNAKIAQGAVRSEQIANGSITNTDLGPGSVTRTRLHDQVGDIVDAVAPLTVADVSALKSLLPLPTSDGDWLLERSGGTFTWVKYVAPTASTLSGLDSRIKAVAGAEFHSA